MKSGVPDKQYFKIGEVARLTALKTSVLRFWESEFDMLSPTKSRTGQRLYSREDLALVLKIKALLYDEKLTIAGARSRLVSYSKHGEQDITLTSTSLSDTEKKLLREVRDDLARLRDSL